MQEIRLERSIWGVVALCLVLGWTQIVLLTAGVVGPLSSGMRILSFGHEQSIPTYSSAFLFLLTSGLSVLAARAARAGGSARDELTWRLIALTTLGLSLDEALSLHEHGGKVLAVLGIDGAWVQDLTFQWVVVGAAVVLVAAIVGLPRVLRLPWPTARGLLIGAALFFGAAVGVEAFTGALIEEPSRDNLLFHWLGGIEETFEFLGAGTLAATVARHLRNRAPLMLAVGGPAGAWQSGPGA